MTNVDNYLKGLTWKPAKKENQVYGFMGNLHDVEGAIVQIYPKCFYLHKKGEGRFKEEIQFPFNMDTLYIIARIQAGAIIDDKKRLR